MERHNGIEPDPEGAFVYYADAQATVEALQAQLDKTNLENAYANNETRNTLIGGIQERDVKISALRQQVEALQRERDEWRSNAVAQEARANDLERDCKDLQSDIEDERAKVKGLAQQVQDQSMANLETMRHTDDMQSRALDAERALAQLQALVRALVGTKSFTINGPDIRTMSGNVLYACSSQTSAERLGALLEYRERALDAKTPAPRQRQVHSCEIPGCVSCANPEEGGDGE